MMKETLTLLEQCQREFDKNFEMKNFALYSKKHDIPATTTEIKYLLADTLKEAAEALEGMKILELCEDKDTDLYEREVGYNQALTDAQKLLLGEDKK